MTIYDIAKEAGVSPTTVSRVINGSSKVKDETRDRVMRVIVKSNYTPSAIARNLIKDETNTIGVMAADIENQFFISTLKGVSNIAEEHKYNVILFDTDEDIRKEHNMLKIAEEQRISGLIVTPVTENDPISREYLARLNETGTPTILLDRKMENSKLDAVFSEDRNGAYEATSALIKEGHTKIAIIKGSSNIRPGLERYKGYSQAMKDNGLVIKDEYVKEGMFRKDKSYIAMKELLESDDPPTAVFTSNNLITLGAIKCIYERKLKIGRDISLIGFDDIEILKDLDFGLSVVSRDFLRMGREAMNLLVVRLSENKGQKVAKTEVTIGTNLILRGSEKMKKDL